MKPGVKFAVIAVSAVLSGAAITAGCSPAKLETTAPLSGFVSDKSADLFGYYLPLHEVRVGRFRLDQLSIGALDDFRKFEPANDRIPTYAPVMLVFSDVSSRQRTNEMGQNYFENAPRVLPRAYRVVEGKISFSGRDKQIGAVTLTGKLDLASMKAVRDSQPSDSGKIVMQGDLTIAGKTFKGVTFGWFGGD